MNIKKINLIYWLYKIQKIYKNKKANNHFGEFAEDVFINRVFKNYEKGFYVDIGAYHPYKGSLTYLLHKKGWRGMNIDLSKVSIDLFKIARKKDINLNCAVSKKNGKIFYYENGAINQQNSILRQNKKQKKIQITSFQFSEIQKKYNINKIDYINIDTEGNELEVLKSINFKRSKPILISVEDNGFNLKKKTKLQKIDYLNKKNYQLINIIGVTMFFLNKQYKNKINKFIKI